MHKAILFCASDSNRLRALLCELRARESGGKIQREWSDLAIEWHLLAGSSTETLHTQDLVLVA